MGSKAKLGETAVRMEESEGGKVERREGLVQVLQGQRTERDGKKGDGRGR